MAYLTKSRFKTGLSCPAKLQYSAQPAVYPSAKEDNPFLEALANGGHQVGEMAKLHFPGGVEVTERNNLHAVERTRELIANGVTTLFEPAFLVGHKYIRVDVLVLKPHTIEVIEVKSKGAQGDDPGQFITKAGDPTSGWRPYIEDLAFQLHVVRLAFNGDGREVKGFLMGVDKTKRTEVDNLYASFPIKKINGRWSCEPVVGLTRAYLGESILFRADLTAICDGLPDDAYYSNHKLYNGRRFLAIIDWFERTLLDLEAGVNTPLHPVGHHCKTCEFKLNQAAEGDKRSGFHQCFTSALGWTDAQFAAPKTWDIWNWRGSKQLVDVQGKFLLDDLRFNAPFTFPVNASAEEREAIAAAHNGGTDDIYDTEPFDHNHIGLDSDQRRWVQIIGMVEGGEPYFNASGFAQMAATFNAPYHFIDFETTAPAVPLFAGYRPSEGVAFQFSHHRMEADGSYTHASEFLGITRDGDPTWRFIEALYDALAHDQGTVFMYSHHENTYINLLIRRLVAESPFTPEQTAEYLNFLQSIARPTGNSSIAWEPGPRVMVDMADLVRRFFWHPIMNGSNSIKVVLPAILEFSPYLQAKYSVPVYGAANGIVSKNFRDWVWLSRQADGRLVDPYKRLPALEDVLPLDMDAAERMFHDEAIGNGGAAMMAWAYMQFGEMRDEEREAISRGLKMYCELDTLAMVMLWEGMREG